MERGVTPTNVGADTSYSAMQGGRQSTLPASQATPDTIVSVTPLSATNPALKHSGGYFNIPLFNFGIYDYFVNRHYDHILPDDFGRDLVTAMDNATTAHDIGLKNGDEHDVVGRGKFISYLANVAKADLPGILKQTEANQLVVRKYIQDLMTERGVRKEHQSVLLPLAVTLAMTPTEADVQAEMFRASRVAVERRDEFAKNRWRYRGDPWAFNWFGTKSKPVGSLSAT